MSRIPENGAAPKRAPRPDNYRVLCISLYTEDIEQLIARVAELKRRGVTNASRSWLIRRALSVLNLDTIAPDPSAPAPVLSEPPTTEPVQALREIALIAMTGTQSALEGRDKAGLLRRSMLDEIRRRARAASDGA
jgi:hypothetical protein